MAIYIDKERKIMSAVGAGVMLALAGMGVRIENQEETQESLEIWISVPEHSYEKDAHGVEMAGEHLAKRAKKMFVTVGLKRLTMKYKVRKGEYWTKEMDKSAQLEMKKIIYGSQY